MTAFLHFYSIQKRECIAMTTDNKKCGLKKIIMWLKQNVTLLQLVHIKLRPLNGLKLLNRNQIGFSSKFSIQIPRQNPNCHNKIDFNRLFKHQF